MNTLNSMLRSIPLATMVVVALIALFGALTYAALYPPFVGAETQPDTLSTLSLTSGTLRPTFAAATTEYRAAVKHNDSQITVTAASGGTVEYLDATDRILDDADTGTTGFQVNLPVTETLFKVKVTSGSDTKTYTVTVERDSAYALSWTPSKDFNTLADAGNENIAGLWGNSTTLYVSDGVDAKIYAYSLATGAHDATKDISLHNDNGDPQGIWSDDTTIWVADDLDDKLYAYTLSTKARDSANDVTLAPNNDNPTDVWGDATHIYVAENDNADGTIYAYKKSPLMYDSSKDITLDLGNIVGIWSDGTTVWWTRHTRSYVIASKTVDGARDPDKSLRLYEDRGGNKLNNRPQRLWSDGETMWVADMEDNKLYSYTLPPAAAGDTTLSALTISYDSTTAALRPAFARGETSYRTAVPSNAPRVTIGATKDDSGSILEYLDINGEALADADAATGFQVDVEVGAPTGNRVNVKVTSSSGDALIYQVVVERDSDRFFGWTPTRDFNNLEAAGNLLGRGVWGNSSTVWVSDQGDVKLYAYNKSTTVRDPSKDITLDSQNNSPNGIWSDGATMWVVNSGTGAKLFAYKLATPDFGDRDPDKDITLASANTFPRGIWANSTTMYVSGNNSPTVFAYKLTTTDFGDRDDTNDITLDVANGYARGIWSNGTTLWVADFIERAAYAYTLADGSRDKSKEFPLAVFDDIWSDGTTLWSAHSNNDKIYSYNMPPASEGDTTLTGLAVKHSTSIETADLRPTFTFDVGTYRVAVASGVTQVTVTPSKNNNSAAVAFLNEDGQPLADANNAADDFQVDLDVGETTVKLKVTVGSTSLTYTLVVERDSTEDWGWTPTKDFNNLTAGNIAIRGVWANTTHFYVSHTLDTKIYAYNRSDGSRADSNDIVLDSYNQHAKGIWSDGTTLWALDDTDEILYAYPLNGDARDSTKDIVLNLASREGALDIWGDGSTIWVPDYIAATVFAYKLTTDGFGDRDSDKDITVASTNTDAAGIWSDDTTMWVSDWSGKRVYAYALADGTRDESLEFELESNHGNPRVLWADDTTMWVMTSSALKKVFSYKMAGDDPVVSVEFEQATYMVAEGSSGTVKVKLDADPERTVTIPIIKANQGDASDSDYSGVPASVVFNSGDTEKTITFTATVDSDNDDGEGVKLSFGRLPTGVSAGTTAETTISITDDDVPSIPVSKPDLTVTEQDVTGDSYTVVLGSRPTAVVTVTIAGHSGTDVTPNPATLTFSTTNWNTAQTVTVTAGNDADTTNDTVTLTHSATSADSDYSGISIASVTVTVNDNDPANVAPTFNEGASTSRTFNETIGDEAVATASNIGNPVTATDTGDTLTYSLDGMDKAKFEIISTNGQLRTKVGEKYSHEEQSSYSVTVKVEDGNSGSDTIAVTLNVMDQNEPPLAPSAPSVSATTGSTTSLDVSWTAPTNTGRPAITNYDLQYQKTTETEWTDGPQNETGLSATIGDLDTGTEYRVQVRATNAEGGDNWSASGNGSTNTPTNALPTFTEGASTSRAFNETLGDEAVATAGNIGTPVAATDADNDTLTYRLEGTAAARFGIVRTSGQLQTKTGQKYDYEEKSSYSVRVKVEDGNSGSDTIAVTLNVMDQDEPPLAPNAPSVSATPGSNNSLDVSWTAPTNTGRPAITNYDLQYQVQGASSWTNGPRNVTNTSTSIPNLTGGTSYRVQVRARNAEGADAWSASGTGRTDTPTAPGVSVLPTVLTVTEEDTAGASYTVVLDSQPTADVTVTVAGHSGTEVTPTPTSLTFTTSNWESAQMVTVIAGADADTENESVTLTHSAASMDSEYQGITIDSVAVTVNDIAVGICGRTKEVRDALVDLIPGVSGCAAVTAADLAAITGTLDLSGQSIAELAAGDFAGLTSLMELYLDNNKLPELPDDVFAGLTSLEVLYLNNNDLTELPGGVFEPLTSLEDLTLNNNDLTTLPGGVFDQLPMLKVLTLYYNALTMLPDGVFELLTRLNFLYMEDNPGVPFAPTADARPDAGRVAVDGGTVTLDGSGSGSGGPWGTNISYSWALTTPASGVTFDDATSVTPEVTIPELAADTELTFTLTVTGRGHIGSGTATATATARVTATLNITNNPPVFAGGAVQARTLNETIGDATVGTAADIGTPVSATDPDTGDTLEYSLLGADRDKFTFDTSSGQIKTRAGENYDYEARTSYSVTVAVIDGTVTVSSTVTINVTDQDEPPPVMNQPVVTATANATTSLEVSWTEPSNPGRPDIDSYDLQYRVGNTGGFSNGPQDKTGSSAAIGNLTADTSYEVRVRATNAEGDGVWSPSGTGQTNAEDNAAPTFDEGGSTTRTFNETVGDATVGTAADIGTPVSATDPDTGDTLEYRLEGTDRTKFGINATSGQIRTKVGESYDYEARTSYSVRVTVNDGTVTVSSAVTINVTDQDEPPPVMNQPVVTATANATTSLEVSWTEPSNPGRPDIDSYDLQYRVGNTGGFSNGPQDKTGSSAAIGNLTADTSYEVRVRATNAEGDGVWSPSGTGTTGRTTITTDPPGVTVSPTALTVTEEDPAGESYRVVLDSQPTAEVVVTVAGHAGTEVTPSPTSLTFTRSNWETGQTVTVTAGSDADTVNDTVTLTHSAASTDSDYDGNSITIASVAVTVTDDDIDTTAAGICGRTEEVRDALLAQTPGVSDCAAVTDAQLAAITGPLNLSGQNITELAAGDFAGLTGLIELYLNNNKLTTLRGDVFAGLPVLKVLTLYYNELDTLPDGVFGQLTALNFLYLGDNPRAPFAPTADARPDAGRVAVDGGTVRLDGSGSGGPWGTNVTYAWALTTPASGVRVTFDDATSVTPEVTIPTLAAGTELTFTLTVTGRGGTDGIETATASARVTATQNITNNPPVFAGGAVQARTFNETMGDATVGTAADIGTPVSATDPDTGDTLEYSLLGADRDKFTFDTSSGQIKTRAGENYDYEARTSYSVTVAVIDGTVTVSSAVTINVTDQDEPPPVMNQPVVTATANATTSLEVSWTEPSNPGRPDIDSYDLQYRAGSTGGFSNGPQDETGSSAAIGNLTADTSYEVRVRATNAEGDGVWSPSGTGTTGRTTITTDTPGVTVSETALTVTEEDMTGESYRVVLDSQPTAEVVVTVAGHAGTEVTPSPTSLTFTRSNWDTAQTVTVTAGSDADTENDTVTLTHSAASADSDYDGNSITIASVTVTVTDNDTGNAAPTFDEGGSTTRTFDETVGDATVGTAAGIGTPVSATDPDTGDTLEYRLEGTDRTKFGINATSGQIRTKVGESYDYEARTSYSVRVTVNDGTVTVSSAVTINVTDQDEPPPVMNQPVVTATANATTSLEVSWTEPSNPGRPDIDSYDLQYRVGNTGGFSNGPQDKTGSSAAIGNLTADTSYEVRVRATNAEGDGVWSPSGTGTTGRTTITTDPPGVTVSETALTVTEEDMTGESYRVVLDSQPTAEVVVTVAGHAGTEVTPSPTSLTFTRSNWETDQTVTVTAGDDADTVNDTVTLTHSAASTDSDYDGNSITIASVAVTVTDDDIDTTAAGICGRTEEVRDALLAQIPGVSDCAAVTAAQLTAITGPLDLSGQNITELAARDFAGLAGLIELYLNNNKLTTLRGDVFAGLTALTQLQLNNNELETLPKDVFAGLPVLKVLTLYDNDLEKLPDGVFEPLTALAYLGLYGNPGAPFAPTAVALPDAGTVPVAGGTVTLDGSGSGPWGTNVTYRWALTTPASGVRVTFDDSTSATPEATIPTLATGTELTFTLTVTGLGGTQGTAPGTDTATVTATDSVTASTDATLGPLRVNDGTRELTLAPAFASGTFASMRRRWTTRSRRSR